MKQTKIFSWCVSSILWGKKISVIWQIVLRFIKIPKSAIESEKFQYNLNIFHQIRPGPNYLSYASHINYRALYSHYVNIVSLLSILISQRTLGESSNKI